jgi:hypothetical protein
VSEPPLDPAERTAALGALRAMEAELDAMSGWLARRGADRRVLVLAEDCTRSLWAMQCLIDRDPRQVLKLVPRGRLN